MIVVLIMVMTNIVTTAVFLMSRYCCHYCSYLTLMIMIMIMIMFGYECGARKAKCQSQSLGFLHWKGCLQSALFTIACLVAHRMSSY